MTGTYGERVDDRLEAGYRESKAIRERRSQDAVVEATVHLGRYHREFRRNANEALKEAYEERKRNGRRREYHFRSDPRRRDNASICIVICAADQAGIYRIKTIGDKKQNMRRDENRIS